MKLLQQAWRGASNREVREVVIRRISDQALWSFGFFGFNLSLSASGDLAKYANMSVAVATALVFVAALRACCINGQIVVGARVGLAPNISLSSNRAVVTASVASGLAVAVTVLWLASKSSSTQDLFLASALTLAIVMSDPLRQLLIYRSRYLSLVGSFLYAAISIPVLLVRTPFDTVIILWCCCLFAVSLLSLGLLLILPSIDGNLPSIRTLYRTGWRLGAESFYVGAANQLPVFLLFLAAASQVTAGVRIAFSIVFAPALMLIQGLSPVLTSRLAFLSAGGSKKGTGRTLVVLWVSGCGILISASAIAAYVGTLALPELENLALALPYVVPAGLYIWGMQSLDARLNEVRFEVAPERVHRFRLWTTAADAFCQTLSFLVFGTIGLLISISLFGAARLILASMHRSPILSRSSGKRTYARSTNAEG